MARKQRTRKPLLDRLADKMLIGDGCWLWTGAIDKDTGYGRVQTVEGFYRGAHRVVYELLVGPIPSGLQLDHLCRVRHCVRPDHLEPVTHRENCLRGVGPPARYAVQELCDDGHPFREKRTARGGRVCLTCKAARARRYAAEKRGG